MNPRLLFLPALLLVLPALGAAQSFVYRGHLDDGGAAAEGRYDLRLTLHGDQLGKQPLMVPIEAYGVQVEQGRFELELDLADLPVGIESGWLEVAVKDPGDSAWWTLDGRSQVQLKGQFCPESWALAGNPDTSATVNFLGTTDDQPLVLRVANARVARYEPKAIFSGLPPRTANVIAGSFVNAVGDDVRGATIAGGGANGDSLVSNASANQVQDHFGTVGGGVSNQAGGVASTVAGGDRNFASGSRAAALGGSRNTASGGGSATLGGTENCAGGSNSLAAGFRAKVRPGTNSGDAGLGCADVPATATSGGDQGSFVWSDASSLANHVSSGPNQFLVRANGGMVVSGVADATSPAENNPAGNRLRVAGTVRVDQLGSAGAEPLCRNASNQISSCSGSPASKDADPSGLRGELEDQRIEIAALREELAALRALLEASLREGGR
jgi:hypothetical protein